MLEGECSRARGDVSRLEALLEALKEEVKKGEERLELSERDGELLETRVAEATERCSVLEAEVGREREGREAAEAGLREEVKKGEEVKGHLEKRIAAEADIYAQEKKLLIEMWVKEKENIDNAHNRERMGVGAELESLRDELDAARRAAKAAVSFFAPMTATPTP